MLYREAVFFLRTIAAVAVISATSITAYSQTPAAGGGAGGGTTEGTSVCLQCWEISNRLSYTESLLDESLTRLDDLNSFIRFYTEQLMNNQLSSSYMSHLEKLGSEAKETEQRISRYEEDVQRLRPALKECVKACQEAGVSVLHVTPGGGNNPFDPLDPLGGGSPRTTTGCTGPQPASETKPQPCPSGQSGSIIWGRDFFCANGAWTLTNSGRIIGNTCVVCTGLSSPPVSEPRTILCPTGQAGTITQIRPYACVNSAWVQGGWEESSNTCTATPPTGCTTPQPASETEQLLCPSGQAGTITQTRGYSCVGNTWTPWPWQTASTSCTCNPLARPQPDRQLIDCPAGQTGNITQQRAYVCSTVTWIHGTKWVDSSNTCTTPQTGCSAYFSGGNYLCGGSCGIGSAGLTVTPGSSSMTASTFGSNSNVGFNCSGPSASSQSTNLIILGAPGHRCTLNGMSSSSLSVLCQNNGGGSCNSSCSR